MKNMERILIKLAVIQFIFLFLAQMLIHQFNLFPQLNQISRYEGVDKGEKTETVETIWSIHSEKD
ncbi:YpfB family protein [Mesobacillus zeae]|uniref:YpfB family protein n=1 Tax=Mesobacillus zeae TaxID=1917180 RepID=A0A398BD21_9BACI|nr:YpfB family protein [Mesobacillus zeae]RID87311.1 hypothetical protein D1970_05135 [Mesobacillus zeae]